MISIFKPIISPVHVVPEFQGTAANSKDNETVSAISEIQTIKTIQYSQWWSRKKFSNFTFMYHLWSSSVSLLLWVPSCFHFPCSIQDCRDTSDIVFLIMLYIPRLYFSVPTLQAVLLSLLNLNVDIYYTCTSIYGYYTPYENAGHICKILSRPPRKLELQNPRKTKSFLWIPLYLS